MALARDHGPWFHQTLHVVESLNGCAGWPTYRTKQRRCARIAPLPDEELSERKRRRNGPNTGKRRRQPVGVIGRDEERDQKGRRRAARDHLTAAGRLWALPLPVARRQRVQEVANHAGVIRTVVKCVTAAAVVLRTRTLMRSPAAATSFNVQSSG